MRSALIVLTLLACSVSLHVEAQDYLNLTGKLVMTGKEVVDPPPGQKIDRAGLFLDGDGAKRLYQAIESKPTNGDICEIGLKLKRAGGLTCGSHKDGSFTCSVAVLTATGQTKPIGAC